jgi:hypothetical protein
MIKTRNTKPADSLWDTRYMYFGSVVDADSENDISFA